MTQRRDTRDRRFMAQALELAAGIPRRPWPNPPVGALVVSDGRVVGRGAHHGPGTRHAEIVALAQAGERAQGATLYCTLEPCNHDGRTPPCAPAVAASGISRLVVGLIDPNTQVEGGGLALVRRAGIDVVAGVLADHALELVWPFATTGGFARPFVCLKTAASLDGCFAPPGPEAAGAGAASPGITGRARGTGQPRLSPSPRYLTGHDARREVHRMRRWADLVLVGTGTMAADRPRLDARLAVADGDGPAAPPLPAYVDANLALEPAWRDRPHVVFTGPTPAPAAANRIREAGGTVVTCRLSDGRVAPDSIVDACRQNGWHVVLLEGGPRLAASFLAGRLVDRWVAFTAPVLLGGGVEWPREAAGLSALPPFHLTRLGRFGADAMAVWDRASFAHLRAGLSAIRGGG